MPPHNFTQGKVTHNQHSCAVCLSGIPGYLKAPEDLKLSRRILDKAEQVAQEERDAIGLNSVYLEENQKYYRHRESVPEARATVINARQKQIGLTSKYVKAFKKAYPEAQTVIGHIGFGQPAIIRENKKIMKLL